ncbi:MAG: radical SAM protein [Bacteroidota bacterium]
MSEQATLSIPTARQPQTVRRQPLPFAAPAMPCVFTLELTTVCNNFCSGCANVELSRLKRDRKNNMAYMTGWREILDALLRNAEPQKIIVRLSGGEPTLHPEFEAVVDFLEENSIPHALLTTGRWTKLRTENLVEIYRRCRHAAGMLVSLHGSNAASHLAFVESTERAFQETCGNIRAASATGIRVFTNTVLTKYACEEIEEIVELSKSLGAACAVFNRFIGEGHPLQPTENQLLRAISTIAHLQNDGASCRIGNGFPKCFAPLTAFPTVAGYELCHISPDGRVRPDNFTPHSFGNLLHQPLAEIWQSPLAEAYRWHFPNTCMDCAALPACRGGIKSPNFLTAATGDPLMRTALSFEQIQDLKEDKGKRALAVLALTSD